MINILVYGDSMSWGIIPGSRNRQPFHKRWPGVLQNELGEDYRIIEECLNGRTTRFEDPLRPNRNGLEPIQMLMASHSPVDLVVVMLGINDFQDVIGVSAEESAEGLTALVAKLKEQVPEPMSCSAKILVVVPPDIQTPKATMAEKFSGFKRGQGAENLYIKSIKTLGVDIFKASQHVSLSAVDGIHLDEPEHRTLGVALAAKVKALL